MLTVAQFTNRNGETGNQPTISGTSEPEAKITITISPDGVGGEVWADANGRWVFRVPKKLSPGEKTILVVATKDGKQGSVTQTFTVRGGGVIGFGTILAIMVLAALVFGGYVIYRSSR